jgi:hypothetical protein
VPITEAELAAGVFDVSTILIFKCLACMMRLIRSALLEGIFQPSECTGVFLYNSRAYQTPNPERVGIVRTPFDSGHLYFEDFVGMAEGASEHVFMEFELVDTYRLRRL